MPRTIDKLDSAMHVYESAVRFVAGARNPAAGRPLANNTRALLQPSGVAIVLHSTPIVTLCPDGTREIRTDGWTSVITRDRLRRYVPGLLIYTVPGTAHRPNGRGVWCVPTEAAAEYVKRARDAFRAEMIEHYTRYVDTYPAEDWPTEGLEQYRTEPDTSMAAHQWLALATGCKTERAAIPRALRAGLLTVIPDVGAIRLNPDGLAMLG
jgi:hypothetical protein